MARTSTRGSSRALGRFGFTLVELLVVIGIIAVLISVLIPALSKAREQSMRIKCASNLHQIAIAETAYAAENKGLLVRIESNNAHYVTNRTGSGRWYDSRVGWQRYIKDPNCFYCPGFSASTFQDRKMAALDPDDKTQMTAPKDAQVGWRVIPLDSQQDLYVSIHYSIFCGWMRARSNDTQAENRLRLVLKPDEPVPASDPVLLNCPVLPNKIGGKNAAEIPLAADVTLREWEGVTPALTAGSLLSQASTLSPSWWASHRRGTRFMGLNTLFLDGHVVWRGPEKAAPRLTWDGDTGATHKYGYLYWY